MSAHAHSASRAACLAVLAACAGCGRSELWEPARPVDAGAVVTPPSASDAGFTLLAARLPTGLHESTAAFDGRTVWIFGGLATGNVFSDQILAFDPATETVTTSPWRLPFGRQASVAVVAGADIYLFGGRSTFTNLLPDIVRFTPATGAVRTMSAKLPTGRYNVGAVWTGTQVLVFGGFDYGTPTTVLRYAPLTDTLTADSAALPSGREGPGALWEGQTALVLGGSFLTEVLRYFPAQQRFEQLPRRLMNESYDAPMLWLGDGVYVYGGLNSSRVPILAVSRYQPMAQTVVELGPRIPEPHVGRSAAAVGKVGYVFGGSNPVLKSLKDTIVRLDP